MAAEAEALGALLGAVRFALHGLQHHRLRLAMEKPMQMVVFDPGPTTGSASRLR